MGGNSGTGSAAKPDTTESTISELKSRVLGGGEISFEEAISLVEIEEPSSIDVLLDAASEITRAFHARQPGLCSLINAKSNLCGEDCAFCSQSVRFDTQVVRYGLLSPDLIVQAAKKAEAQGAKNFCIVTSGADLNDEEFEQALSVIKRLQTETHLGIDASLGFLTPERAYQLKEVGLRMFNHNVQTSRDFYSDIVSTHSYDTRLETLEHLCKAGVGICSGGILGMGESREDRIRMAFEVKRFQPQCFPVNILNPRPGTPLQNVVKLDPTEVLKTIAVYRFILPKSNIKLAGGREPNLGKLQRRALCGGANGLVVGGYLTTAGDPIAQDFQMLRECGYEA